MLDWGSIYKLPAVYSAYISASEEFKSILGNPMWNLFPHSPTFNNACYEADTTVVIFVRFIYRGFFLFIKPFSKNFSVDPNKAGITVISVFLCCIFLVSCCGYFIIIPRAGFREYFRLS